MRVRMCFLKQELLENADLQTSQENGLSPMCVSMWIINSFTSENAHLQN